MNCTPIVVQYTILSNNWGAVHDCKTRFFDKISAITTKQRPKPILRQKQKANKRRKCEASIRMVEESK